MELQKKIIEAVDRLEIVVLCPGLAKEEVKISFDRKEGILEIFGESPKTEKLLEDIDLSISGKINISPKYRSKDPKVYLENGLLKVTFTLASSVQILEVSEEKW